MHTTRNIFKSEKFNMKNTETAFYSFLTILVFIAAHRKYWSFS